MLLDAHGKVYLLGAGKVQCTGTDYAALNFEFSEAGKAEIPPPYENMQGATEKAAGKAGLVPAPAAGEIQRFLSADGDWDNPITPIYVTTANTSLNSYTTSGIYLFGLTYKPIDAPGNSENGFLLVMAYSATAIKQVWFKFAGDDYQTFVRTKADAWTGWSRVITYNDVFKGATDSAVGDRGLVPGAVAGSGHLYLKGSGGWGNPFTPTGTDGTGKSLKSYVTSGLYLFTKSQMPTDPPSADCINGWLLVIATSPAALKQIWFNLAGGNSSGHYTYIRTCNETTWSDWRRFETTTFSSINTAIYGANQEQAEEIMQQLVVLDSQTIRPLRAILAGTPTDEDKDKLREIEEQAVALRAELASLEAGDENG